MTMTTPTFGMDAALQALREGKDLAGKGGNGDRANKSHWRQPPTTTAYHAVYVAPFSVETTTSTAGLGSKTNYWP